MIVYILVINILVVLFLASQDRKGIIYQLSSYSLLILQLKAGVCTDMDDTESIKAAITEMDSNYEEYSQNAVDFYESFDVKKL